MHPLPPFHNAASPRHVLATGHHDALPTWREHLMFFLPGKVWPSRYWEESDSGASEPAPIVPEEPPLSPREQLLYGVFAVMTVWAFLTLTALIVLAHSPIIAN
jgi:hypothetical protein